MMLKKLLLAASAALFVVACGTPRAEDSSASGSSADGATLYSSASPANAAPCADALMAYAERYPQAEPQDLYKLVFQDLYGPGHLLTDSAACARYIERELADLSDTSAMPLYEYTACSGRFVRVDLRLVAAGRLSVGQLTSAVMRSAQGIKNPDPRFVLSHSAAFRAAYQPHYRLVRSDIFEREILPLIK